MTSKNNQLTEDNYIAGSDDLQNLTISFKNKLLDDWTDADGNKKLVEIDGQKVPLRVSHVKELLNYAREYTEIWIHKPDNMKLDFKNEWFIDCRGLYIEGEIGFSNIDKGLAPVRFRDSIISSYYLSKIIFASQKFLGYAGFYNVEFITDACFAETKFYGDVRFNGSSFRRDAIFSDCVFKKDALFEQTKFKGQVDFAKACFNRVPLFQNAVLPQGTSFDEATFDVANRRASQEDIYNEMITLRTLRQIAASYKGQQDESKFFALEQRACRKISLSPRLVWRKKSLSTPRQGQQGFKDLLVLDTWRNWKHWSFRCKPIEWLISLAYDCISEYGSNPGRAVIWLIAINLVAWLLYQNIFTFGECSIKPDFCLTGNVPVFAQQYPAIFFALQNLLNPSAIVSYKALVIVNNLFMAILTIIQFTLTYIILILTALAIRTRFQKGAGGDK